MYAHLTELVWLLDHCQNYNDWKDPFSFCLFYQHQHYFKEGFKQWAKYMRHGLKKKQKQDDYAHSPLVQLGLASLEHQPLLFHPI